MNNEGVRYLALLRGINVGGKNIVRMSDLQSSFECLGCKNVTTYIQSGNVIFESTLKNAASLALKLEKALGAEFGCTSLVVVVPREQLDHVVSNPPPEFGTDPALYRYDVVFLKSPPHPREILPAISLKDGVDEASEGDGVLYFRRLIARASQSHFPRLTRHAAYKNMTIRNWNTTRELHRLLLQ